MALSRGVEPKVAVPQEFLARERYQVANPVAGPGRESK